MARITVEDCIVRVPSRFELVMLSAQRARDVSAGAPLTLDRDNDKNPVVALREIADQTIDLDNLRYELIHGLRRHVALGEEEDEAPESRELAAMEMPGLAPEDEAGRAALDAEDVADDLDEDLGDDLADDLAEEEAFAEEDEPQPDGMADPDAQDGEEADLDDR